MQKLSKTFIKKGVCLYWIVLKPIARLFHIHLVGSTKGPSDFPIGLLCVKHGRYGDRRIAPPENFHPLLLELVVELGLGLGWEFFGGQFSREKFIWNRKIITSIILKTYTVSVFMIVPFWRQLGLKRTKHCNKQHDSVTITGKFGRILCWYVPINFANVSIFRPHGNYYIVSRKRDCRLTTSIFTIYMLLAARLRAWANAFMLVLDCNVMSNDVSTVKCNLNNIHNSSFIVIP